MSILFEDLDHLHSECSMMDKAAKVAYLRSIECD